MARQAKFREGFDAPKEKISSWSSMVTETIHETMSDVSDTGAKRYDLQSIIKFVIVLVMVAAFLYQMWELFGQFLSGLTTVAITFEEREDFELPSFAFCDSRAFTRSVGIEETLASYNSTTFDVDQEVKFNGKWKTVGGEEYYFKVDHTTQIVPTMFNGNCKLYEFNQSHPVKTYIGISIVDIFHFSVIHNFPLLLFRICSAFKQVI